MAGNVRKRFLDFYRRQRFRLKNKQQIIKIAIRNVKTAKGLSLGFATLCIVDLFGVFPIVALPQTLISCGYYGLPLLIFVITIQIYTAVILGKCWTIAEKLDPTIITKNRYPYAAIAELIYGKYMRVFVTILLDVTVFGAGVPNLLVASQNLQLLGHRISNGEFYFSFCYWLILLGLFLCPIMWLGSPKNMKALASVSVFTCSLVAVFIWACIVSDAIPMQNDNKAFDGIRLDFPSIENLLKTYGIIAFQFDIHPMLLTIQVDMQEKQLISKAVCYGIFITCFLSITTTTIAAYRYGIAVTPNVLEILPRSNTLYFAIMLVTLQLCLSSAVGSSPLFQHIEDILKIPKKFCLRRCFIRSVLVALAVVIGELIPKFDLVMGIIGGTLTGPLIFILPPLFYTKITNMEQIFDEEQFRRDQERRLQLDDDSDSDILITKTGYGTFNRLRSDPITKISFCSNCKRILKLLIQLLHSDCVISVAVVMFGLCATFASTYYSLINVTDVKDFWSPCISNISYSFISL